MRAKNRSGGTHPRYSTETAHGVAFLIERWPSGWKTGDGRLQQPLSTSMTCSALLPEILRNRLTHCYYVDFHCREQEERCHGQGVTRHEF